MEEIKKLLPSSLYIENKEKLTVTGVTDMGAFNEDCVIVFTDGTRLEIRGEDLEVRELSVESGNITVLGKINAVSFHDNIPLGKGGLFAKVFR